MKNIKLNLKGEKTNLSSETDIDEEIKELEKSTEDKKDVDETIEKIETVDDYTAEYDEETTKPDDWDDEEIFDIAETKGDGFE